MIQCSMMVSLLLSRLCSNLIKKLLTGIETIYSCFIFHCCPGKIRWHSGKPNNDKKIRKYKDVWDLLFQIVKIVPNPPSRHAELVSVSPLALAHFQRVLSSREILLRKKIVLK